VRVCGLERLLSASGASSEQYVMGLSDSTCIEEEGRWKGMVNTDYTHANCCTRMLNKERVAGRRGICLEGLGDYKIRKLNYKNLLQ
jgi:hypothetical protein